MTLLELKGITKKYSKADQFAVNDVSFEVEKGEILFLVGESGSGKTSLLRMIAGLEHPDLGYMSLEGKRVFDRRNSVPASRRNVGMIFQDYALFPHLTLLENVMYGLTGKISSPEKVAKETLSLVGLSENFKKYPHQLSGGQQQRVALARALAPRPALLLLDDPFSNLDAGLKDQVREEIRQIIKETGMTSIFVTHNTRDALSTADRIAILHKGYLQQIDTPRNLYEYPANGYVANFFGRRNEILAVSTDDGFYSSFGFLPDERSKLFTDQVRLSFRPENVRIGKNDAQLMSGKLTRSAYMGDHQLLHIMDEEGRYIYVRTHVGRMYEKHAVIFFHIEDFSVDEA